MKHKLENKQGNQNALTLALVLAVCANTAAKSRRAVLLAGTIAAGMEAQDVAQCQANAKRVLDARF